MTDDLGHANGGEPPRQNPSANGSGANGAAISNNGAYGPQAATGTLWEPMTPAETLQKEQTRIRRAIEERHAVHVGRYNKILLASCASFVLSSWLTAKGLFDKAIEAGVANAEGMVTALMSSGVAATLVGGGTMLLFGIAMDAKRRQLWQVVALAGSLMPFTLGISTYNAVLGNAGPPSLIYDMRDKASAYTTYYESSSTDASGAQSAQAALTPLEASVCGLAGDEKSHGVLTGAAGKGAVFAAYTSGCKSIRAIIATLADTVVRTDRRRDDAATIIADLSSIPKDTTQSVFERQNAFRLKVNSLRKLIEESGAENVAARLTAQLKILQSSVATLGVQDTGLGKKQSDAIRNLKSALGLVNTTINELLVGGMKLRTAPPGDLLEMGAAVGAYWQRNVPQILLAILIDVMSIWFVGLLMVSRTIVRDRD